MYFFSKLDLTYACPLDFKIRLDYMSKSDNFIYYKNTLNYLINFSSFLIYVINVNFLNKLGTIFELHSDVSVSIVCLGQGVCCVYLKVIMFGEKNGFLQ